MADTADNATDRDSQAQRDQEILGEQVRNLYRRPWVPIIATLINAALLVYIQRHQIPLEILWIWFAAMCLAIGARITLVQRYEARAPGPETARRWAFYYTVAAGLTGCVWGGAGWFLLPTESPLHQLFTCVVLAGMTAGAMSSLSYIFPAFVAFVMPTLVPLLVALLSFGTEVHVAIAGLAMLFALYIIGAARQANRSMRASFSLRSQNAALVDRLQEETGAALEAGKTLQQEIEDHFRTQEALRNSERRLRDFAESAADWFWETDAAHRFTYVSVERESLAGISSTDYLGRSLAEATFPEVPEEARSRLSTALTNLESFDDFRFTRLGLDGEKHDLSISGKPVFGAEGSFIGYRGAGRDIGNLIVAERAAIEARDKAEAANLSKTQFLSSMSHELRTPLNAILGFGQVLQMERNQFTAEQQDSIDQVVRNGEQLLALINDVLDFSAIESGRMKLRRAALPVSVLLEECIPVMASLANERGLRFQKPSRSMAEVFVHADRTRLKQILMNFASNAAKYNEEGGLIALDCGPDCNDHHVRFAITDTGPGIPKERQAELFTPFNRLGKEASNIQGTGIGLSICKRLAEAMGGTLGFTSEPGRGSTFWVSLPRASATDVVADTPPTAPRRPAV